MVRCGPGPLGPHEPQGSRWQQGSRSGGTRAEESLISVILQGHEAVPSDYIYHISPKQVVSMQAGALSLEELPWPVREHVATVCLPGHPSWRLQDHLHLLHAHGARPRCHAQGGVRRLCPGLHELG